MSLSEYIRYVGRMKQPLQKMDVDAPSMYALADPEKYELCLIILTPGVFCHAYNFIKKSEARTVKLFFPTLRPEFISDIMNLYMTLKNIKPIKWVFPEKYNHYSFSIGHERCDIYHNSFDPKISIEYKENEKVDRLYDLIVKCEEGMHYFSLYMTDEKCTELFYCKPCTFIHVSKSAPIYGGMCYDSLLHMNRKFRKKLVPFDFTSIEEYVLFKGGIVHRKETPPEPPKIEEEEDEHKHHKHKHHCPHPPKVVDKPGSPVEDDEWTPEEPEVPDDPEETPMEPDTPEEKVEPGTDPEVKEEDGGSQNTEESKGGVTDAEDSTLQGSE